MIRSISKLFHQYIQNILAVKSHLINLGILLGLNISVIIISSYSFPKEVLVYTKLSLLFALLMIDATILTIIFAKDTLGKKLVVNLLICFIGATVTIGGVLTGYSLSVSNQQQVQQRLFRRGLNAIIMEANQNRSYLNLPAFQNYQTGQIIIARTYNEIASELLKNPLTNIYTGDEYIDLLSNYCAEINVLNNSIEFLNNCVVINQKPSEQALVSFKETVDKSMLFSSMLKAQTVLYVSLMGGRLSIRLPNYEVIMKDITFEAKGLGAHDAMMLKAAEYDKLFLLLQYKPSTESFRQTERSYKGNMDLILGY